MKLRVFVLPIMLLYPLYASFMFAEQRAVLFPAASSEHYALRAPLPSNAELIEIPASFGKVRAVYLRAIAQSAHATAILYTHGNFECVENSFSALQPLPRAGLAVLQVEFPGFCGADGEPTFAAINETEIVAFDWLTRQAGIDPTQIVAMGYSMGGGAATQLTRQRDVRALVLISTYTSIEDIAHRYALPGFLVRYPFDNRAAVRTFPGPVLIEHGRRDRVIPFAMGQQLAAAAKNSEFVALDCGHDDCGLDHTLFAQRLPDWLVANHLLSRSVGDGSPNEPSSE